MRFIPWVRFALAVSASGTLLASCGTPSTTMPQQNPATIRSENATLLSDAGSWMAPDAANQDLLYVSDARGVIDVFSYPAGKRVGLLKGLQSPAGLCSDPLGNVFVANTNALDVVEYRHGGAKPIQVLNDLGHYPYGCSVDPATENLAVANFAGSHSFGPGSVSIFLGAKGLPRSYQAPGFNTYYFCGYDDKSNLFVDGADLSTVHTLFAEFPKGATKFTDITLNQTIGYPGAVQWDGKYMAVGDIFARALYRFKVAGTKATSAGKVSFTGNRSTLIAQFWIDGSTIVLPYGKRTRSVRRVGYWQYPGGGTATKSLKVVGATELVGATVSLPKR